MLRMPSLKNDLISRKNLRAKLKDTLDSVAAGRIVAVTNRRGEEEDGEGTDGAELVMMNIEQFEAMQEAQALLAEYHMASADAAEARAGRGESLDGDEVLRWLDNWQQTNYGRPALNIDDVADLSTYLDVTVR